jgi:hypothetical protein
LLLLLLLLLLLSCVGARKKFLCEERGDQNNNNTLFRLFVLSRNLFGFHPPQKTFTSINQIKMADTSMDYSEYSENENSPMPVAKVRESIRIER